MAQDENFDFVGAMVVIIKAQGGDHGLQKLFGTFGAVIFGPITGKLIDLTGGSYKYVLISWVNKSN